VLIIDTCVGDFAGLVGVQTHEDLLEVVIDGDVLLLKTSNKKRKPSMSSWRLRMPSLFLSMLLKTCPRKEISFSESLEARMVRIIFLKLEEPF